MPKLKPEAQQARRDKILDAAELCFARSGFHRTTMQDIRRAAGISAGAVYVYYDSKEALIAGLCRRDRAKLAKDLEAVGKAPDLFEGLAALGRHYTVEEPAHKRALHLEIGSESTRSPAISLMMRAADRHLCDQLKALLEAAVASGKIKSTVEPAALADAMCVIGDGLMWRRAVDPEFDAVATIPTLIAMIRGLVGTVPPSVAGPASGKSPPANSKQRERRTVRS